MYNKAKISIFEETMDKKRFAEICDSYNDADKDRNSIGLLSEKTMHAVIKRYLEKGHEQYAEQKIGKYHADLFHDGEIAEIQTRQFGRLRDKLAFFLPDYPVTVVYPIPKERSVSWIDPKTGDISKPRKSPKRGKATDVFYELYQIREFMTHENFHLKLLLVNVCDYRMLSNSVKNPKKGSVRYERLPIELCDEIDIDRPCDYFQIVPYLEGEFTCKDFASAAKMDVDSARVAINLLMPLGLTELCGKDGKKYLYRFLKKPGEQ